MRLYFVRHGDPNYKDNCLTPLGHLQAEALAERLKNSSLKFDALYSSKYGRASETAQHTSDKLGMPFEILDFIHEIKYGSPDMTKEEKLAFSPWLCCADVVRDGNKLTEFDFDSLIYWQEGAFKEENERVITGFDEWMKTLGYEREGMCYRVNQKNSKKLMIFSHGGAISCVIAHLMGVNPFVITQYFRFDCTSITEIEFKGETGELSLPVFRSLNDHSHMVDIVYTEAKE